MRRSDDGSGPTDPLTSDLTAVFQAITVVSVIVLVAAIVVIVVGIVRRRDERPLPRALTTGAVIAAAVAVVLMAMGFGAGVVVA